MALLLVFILHSLHVVREGLVATPFELGSYPSDLLDGEWKDWYTRSEPLTMEIFPGGLLSFSRTARDKISHEIIQSFLF